MKHIMEEFENHSVETKSIVFGKFVSLLVGLLGMLGY